MALRHLVVKCEAPWFDKLRCNYLRQYPRVLISTKFTYLYNNKGGIEWFISVICCFIDNEICNYFTDVRILIMLISGPLNILWMYFV